MIANILIAKLEAINADCEAEALSGINKLYSEARYDGTRFKVPSFQSAGAIWSNLISEKENKFVAEIGKVLRTPGVVFEDTEMKSVRDWLEENFAEPHYVERMSRFSEAVARCAASYGLPFDAAGYRIDIRDAAYRAGVKNALRRARAIVFAELDLQSRTSTPEIVISFAKWWLYFRSNPCKSTAAVLILVLVPWIISKVSISDALSLFQILFS